jgi:hypothetical protein
MFTPAQALPGASAKHSRVPEFVRTLEVQQPHPGEFTIDDLQWVQTNNRGVSGMVAGFHKDRLDDFVRGECTRGDTAINRERKGNTALLVNLVCRCKYAAHRKTADRQKAALHIHEHQGRCSKLVTGQTVKKGCGYCFTVKEYAKHPGLVIVKFTGKQGEGMCATMLHVDTEGQQVHAGLKMHMPHTAEVRDFITARLKANCATKTILKGKFIHGCILTGII